MTTGTDMDMIKDMDMVKDTDTALHVPILLISPTINKCKNQEILAPAGNKAGAGQSGTRSVSFDS